MEAPVYWVHIQDIWPTDDGNRDVYDVVLDEMRGDLSRGTIKVRGGVYQERRLTAMYSKVANSKMSYSGRVLAPIQPREDGYLSMMLDMVNSPEFREVVYEDVPHIRGTLPDFNGVFVNWYRPPSLVGADMDYLGPHSDDLRGMDSEIILSLTFCQPGGERLFSMLEKASGESVAWQAELGSGDILIMLQDCQKYYKHTVSARRTHLDRTPVIGGRINFTFRCLKVY